jgi:hypothetical protein
MVNEKRRADWEKSPCKPVEQEENHEKGPIGSWAGNHMGNPIPNGKFQLI